MMISPDVKEMWVAALRFGDYQQGRGVLKWDEQFCCLGVLCDLAVQDDPAQFRWERGVLVVADGKREEATLPLAVWKWAGGSERNYNQEVSLPVSKTYLTILNDGGGGFTVEDDGTVDSLTFDEIADVIEDEL